MEDKREPQRDPSPTPSPSHRRAPSSPGLLSKFPFIRYGADHPTQVSEDDDQRHDDPQNDTSQPASARPFTATGQQHKTRRRRGSLRKVALLGRGAQRDRGDSRGFGGEGAETSALQQSDSQYGDSGVVMAESDALGLHEPNLTPRASHDPRISQISLAASNPSSAGVPGLNDRVSELPSAYNSTTDEDDILHIPHGSTANRAGLSISSGSESYFGNRGSAHRQRPFQQTKSPLSYSGLSKTSLPPPDSDWDYAETEWWGWVVLGVTWFVFVIGMGSCLNVWSWAWDIGKTPYAPPELEDDPTLPIVGYYPALIILTGVMAWVWVVVAWVGMKYFRHAKISGD